jgi:eukaryotic-like serine/threonine-protein kinase
MLPATTPQTLPRISLASEEPVSSVIEAAPPADPYLLPLGSILAGTYELRSLLGNGGMAQVFEGYDRQLDRHVAVKVARPMVSEALRSEGRALAAVRHPLVVTVFHAGVHDGFDYLVLERIVGHTLRDRLDGCQGEGAPLPIPTVVSLLNMLAEALSVVHDAGLAHRDLKPDNVMMRPGDRIVLTDFGLTRAEFVETAGQRMSGSPDYMAPEVILRSEKRGAGHLVDLYALGIVAYELLIGQTPFAYDHWVKTLEAHLSEPPPDPRALRPDVPDPLAELIAQLLAKDPEDRPESAEMVLWMLQGPRNSRRASAAV